MVQTYDEFNVRCEGKKIVAKTPTKRKQVRISEHTARVNNQYSDSTGLHYVLNKKATAEVNEKQKEK